MLLKSREEEKKNEVRTLEYCCVHSKRRGALSMLKRNRGLEESIGLDSSNSLRGVLGVEACREVNENN